MSDVDLAAVLARADAATQGPWRSKDALIWPEDEVSPPSVAFVADWEDPQRLRADAEFIAHARTDVPQMAALITDMQAKLAAVEAVRHAWEASKARGGGHPYITGTLAACIGDLSDALAASPVADSSLLPKEQKR